MINYHTDLVSALETILPTHYEMALTSGTETPCISYMELNNYLDSNGIPFSTTGLHYSRITFQIKVWGRKLEELQRYAQEIDKVLRPLGWIRISSGELYDNNSTMMQKIMTFEALASEIY